VDSLICNIVLRTGARQFLLKRQLQVSIEMNGQIHTYSIKKAVTFQDLQSQISPQDWNKFAICISSNMTLCPLDANVTDFMKSFGKEPTLHWVSLTIEIHTRHPTKPVQKILLTTALETCGHLLERLTNGREAKVYLITPSYHIVSNNEIVLDVLLQGKKMFLYLRSLSPEKQLSDIQVLVRGSWRTVGCTAESTAQDIVHQITRKDYSLWALADQEDQILDPTTPLLLFFEMRAEFQSQSDKKLKLVDVQQQKKVILVSFNDKSQEFPLSDTLTVPELLKLAEVSFNIDIALDMFLGNVNVTYDKRTIKELSSITGENKVVLKEFEPF